MVAEAKRPAAVYIPWKTLLTSTEVLAQGLPKKLDGSAFPTFAGGMRSWTLSAYRFLGFIDKDGNVQPSLGRWIQADADERKAIMAALLKEQYGEVVRLASEHGTPSQMRTEIEKLGVSGSSTQRAVRFFLDAAAFADITVPASWKKMTVSTGSTSTRRRRRAGAALGRGGATDSDDDNMDDMDNGYTLPVLDQALIRGLIEMMPRPGNEWADVDQEQWIALAKSIFKMVYKQPVLQLPASTTAVQAVAH